jgi:hypothetical protein
MLEEAKDMDREKRIREIAYSLWVAEGYPTGQKERHWRMAEQMFAEEGRRRSPADEDSGATPKAAPRKPEISDESAIGDDPESRGDPYVGSAK